MSITEIKKLSLPKRLQLMEQLWDSLCQEESAVESPAWHERILKERRKKIDAGEAKFFTLDQIKERFR